jgi:hypothetical protein
MKMRRIDFEIVFTFDHDPFRDKFQPNCSSQQLKAGPWGGVKSIIIAVLNSRYNL